MFFVFALLFSVCACSKSDEKAFNALRSKVEAAGYEINDVFVDSKFEDVVAAFAVKVNFDAKTSASIPIILTSNENAAKKNCGMFGEGSIKLPIRNGSIFSYPGKDYPEEVLNLITAIINGEEIPKI